MNASKQVAVGGLIAAMYILLTYVAEMLGLASGAFQMRFSEALTLLPSLTAAAVPGLFLGCLLANLLTGCAFWDIVFGSLATLLGALGTYALRDRPRLLWIPPVASNTLIIPPMLVNVYGVEEFLPLLVMQIFVGEMLVCCFLGYAVLRLARKICVDLNIASGRHG